MTTDFLHDKALLRTHAFIDGDGVPADDGAAFPVVNPANGQRLVSVADRGAAETQRAIAAADVAWPGWRALSAKARGAILRRWFDRIVMHQEDLAR